MSTDPSNGELEEKILGTEKEVLEIKRSAEKTLRERTQQLFKANEQLKKEIARVKRITKRARARAQPGDQAAERTVKLLDAIVEAAQRALDGGSDKIEAAIDFLKGIKE